MSEQISKDPNVIIRELVAVCRQKTWQGYKLRSLLYSLWNGQPKSLLDVVCLDKGLKVRLLIVMMCFGDSDFFYDQVKAAFVEAGLFDWFIEEGEL